MLLKMAFRNVFRNGKRTLISILAVFLGVLLSLLFNGLNQGLRYQIRDLFIKTYCSNIEVVSNNFIRDELENPLDYPIYNYREIEKNLSQDHRIKCFSPRITFQGRLNNGIDEIQATGIGVDPQREDAVFNRSQGIISGGFLKGKEDSMAIGADLAELLGIKVGDTISLVAKATQMGDNAIDLKVEGIIHTGNPTLDGKIFFVPLSFASDFLSLNGITDVAVSLRDNSQIDIVATQLKHNLSKETSILTWQDYTNDFMKMVNFRQQAMNMMGMLVLLVAAVGIVNTMLMSVTERTREVGNLLAQGVSRLKIIWLFLLEGGIIGFLGGLAAAFLGTVILFFGQTIGIPIEPSKLGNVPIAGRLYFNLNFMEVFRYMIIGIFFAALATLYPAFKSVRLEPVEALRGDRR